jgi:photosystem II stability/assembly factor-like uncharacterized protein
VEARELEGRDVRALVAARNGVFAATDQGVFVSVDGGSTWRSTNLRASTFALACTEGGALLAGTESGVYRSDDYGETWALIGLKGKRVNALASAGAAIYAGTSEGVYAAADGTTWKRTGLYGNVVSLAVQPGNPKVVYAGTAGGFSEKLEDFGDFYYSTDGGVSWTRYWLCNDTQLALLLGGFPLYYAVNAILVNPCDPREVYVGTSFLFTVLVAIPAVAGGVWASRDFGRSLHYTGPRSLLRALLEGGGVNALALSVDRGWLLAGTSNGIFLSTNKGEAWLELGPANASVKAVAIDSEGRIYAGRLRGLSVFHHKPLATSLSANASMSGRGSLRVSGVLASGDAGLLKRAVRVLLNGREAAVCYTGSRGEYECAASPEASDGSTLNLTVYFPGDFCYLRSSKTLILHRVSVSAEHGKVSGEGWYGTGWYPVGSTIRVSTPPVVEVPPGVRYVFKWWKIEKPSGIETSATPSLELTVDAPTNLTAVCARQYLIKAEVEAKAPYERLCSPVGGGWYDEGSEAVLKVQKTVVFFSGNRTVESCTGSGCSRLLFEGWYRNGSLVSKDPSVVIAPVSGPVELEAKWKVQHYVKVATERGSAEGEGWYDDGSYATVKLAATDVDAVLVTYHFERWEGLEASDAVIERGLVRALVDKPRNLVAVWRADYTRVFILIGLALITAAIILVGMETRRVARAEEGAGGSAGAK